MEDRTMHHDPTIAIQSRQRRFPHVPGIKRQVNVTLRPQEYDALLRQSEVTGMSMGSLARGLIQGALAQEQAASVA
jgi:hypothetical protein